MKNTQKRGECQSCFSTTGCHQALAERDKEIVGEIERMERELHPSGHHLRRQALSDIKALLTPPKGIK